VLLSGYTGCGYDIQITLGVVKSPIVNSLVLVFYGTFCITGESKSHMQCLGVVDKIAMFPCFSELSKACFSNKCIIKFLKKLKGGHLWFLELRKLDII